MFDVGLMTHRQGGGQRLSADSAGSLESNKWAQASFHLHSLCHLTDSSQSYRRITGIICKYRMDKLGLRGMKKIIYHNIFDQIPQN